MSKAELSESEFEKLASETLAAIETAIEAVMDAADLDLDLQMKPGGVLELEFDNGRKMIINRQSATHEIWVAAPSGGFHFFYDGSHWVDTRDGSELFSAISVVLGAQSGMQVTLARP